MEKTLRNAGGFRIIRSAGSRHGIELLLVDNMYIIVFVEGKKWRKMGKNGEKWEKMGENFELKVLSYIIHG